MPEEFTEPKTFSNFHKLKRQCLDEMRFLVNYFSGTPTPHFQWEFLRRSLQSLIRLRAAARLAAESAAPHFLDPFQELVKLLIAQSIDIAIPVLKVEFDHPTVFAFLRSKRLEQKYTSRDITVESRSVIRSSNASPAWSLAERPRHRAGSNPSPELLGSIKEC